MSSGGGLGTFPFSGCIILSFINIYRLFTIASVMIIVGHTRFSYPVCFLGLVLPACDQSAIALTTSWCSFNILPLRLLTASCPSDTLSISTQPNPLCLLSYLFFARMTDTTLPYFWKSSRKISSVTSGDKLLT